MPSYRQHKPSGQAVVTISGRDIYLGKWNTKASRAEYDRLIGEWLAAGRCLPRAGHDLTVAELARAYLKFAKGYYLKDGKPTGWLVHIKLVIRGLRAPTATRLLLNSVRWHSRHSVRSTSSKDILAVTSTS